MALFPEEAGFPDLDGPVLAWTAPLRAGRAPGFPEKGSFPAQENKPNQENARATAANLPQPDLFYLESVLCTAGEEVDPDRGLPVGWNNNDDVFLAIEAWAARSTPEDKPLNLGHDCARIVGHITGVSAEDLLGNPLASGPDEVVAPAAFNLVTGGVLYRVWFDGPKAEHDQAREEEIERVIAELPEGKWGVSMECLVGRWDYGLWDGARLEVVPRTKATAHLSRHLRRAKGSGEYQGRRVGRVIRDLVFSGKGIVQNPANPKSVVRAETLTPPEGETETAADLPPDFPQNPTEKPTEKPTASGAGVYPPQTPAPDGGPTPERRMDLDTLKQELAAAKAELADAKRQAAEAEKAKFAETEQALAAERKAKDELAQAHQAASAQTKGEVEKLVAEKAALEAELSQAKAALAEIEQAKAELERVGKVVEALKLDQDKAQAMVQTLKGLDDAAFAAHLDVLATAVTVTAPMQKTATNNPQAGNTTFGGKTPQAPQGKTGLPGPSGKTGLKAPARAFASDEGGDDAGDPSDLDAAKPDPQADLAVAASAENAKAARSKVLAKVFGWRGDKATNTPAPAAQ